MSALNGERHLQQAVQSVLSQTHTDFDFIAVNDGSTDSTGEILDTFAAQDKRLRVIHNDVTLTYVEGRARGIREATTEWVAIMDADDVCHPTRLERQVAFIKAHGETLGAAGTWARYINDTGDIVGRMRLSPTTEEEFRRRFEARDSLVLLDPSSVFHLPTYHAVGGYRPETVPAADLDLWYRIAESGRTILIIPETLMDYRVHLTSMSVSNTLLQREKTHFIHYNMRRRRDHLEEIDWLTFRREVWNRPLYRLPRKRRDLSFHYFKRAGLCFGYRHYGRFFINLVLSSLFDPALAARRLANQLRMRWSG